jgi:bud site selection protein 20
MEEEEPKAAEYKEDVPGGGLHYCLFCARNFIDEANLQIHFKTKYHKKMVKRVNEEPYSLEEAERAAGMTHEKY